MVVYKITNSLNDKIYIGQTRNSLATRFYHHCYYEGVSAIGAAIRKYGKDNFKIEIISRCNSIEEMNHREIYYIRLLKTLAPNGYNLVTGGNKYYGDSEETKRKRSEASRGEKNGMFGKKASLETRAKMSASRKGKKRSPESVERLAAIHRGMKRSDEARKNISDACKGRVISEETKKKLSDKLSGKGNPRYGVKIPQEQIDKLKQCNVKSIYCPELDRTFISMTAASQELGIDRAHIGRVVNGKNKRAKGLTFKLIEKKVSNVS